MSYLILKILTCLLGAGFAGFIAAWWWTRYNERRRSNELEGVWTQKIQRANRELDALRSDLRTEATRTQAAVDAETALKARLISQETEKQELEEKAATLAASLAAAQRGRQEASTALAGGGLDWAAKASAFEAELLVRDKRVAESETTLTSLRAEISKRDEQTAELEGRLKELSELPARLRSAEEKLRSSERTGAAAQGEITKAAQTIAGLEPLRAAVQERDAKLKEFEVRYNSLLKEKDGALARMLSQIGELEPLKGRLAEADRNLKKAIAEKDVEIASLRTAVTEAKAQTAAVAKKLEGVISDNLAEVARLTAVVAHREDTLATIESDLQPPPDDAASTGRIAELQAVIADNEARLSVLDSEIARLSGLLAQPQAAPAPKPARKRAAPRKKASAAATDDLKLIQGVGPEVEERLHKLGVTQFAQIARWTPQQIDDLDDLADLIRRDNWVASAREEYGKKYGNSI